MVLLRPVNARRGHMSGPVGPARVVQLVRPISAPLQALQQVQHTEPSCPIIQAPNTAQSSREEDLDKDSGSKVTIFTPLRQLRKYRNTFLTRKGRFDSISVSELNGTNVIKIRARFDSAATVWLLQI